MIISNTTPFIYFHRVGRIDLLRQLFGRVYIPKEVSKELQLGQRGESIILDLEWIEVVSVQNRAIINVLAQNVDLGEAEVLALAMERSASRVIIDDALARMAAALLQIPVIGTVGILITSKTGGLLTTVKEPLDAMISAGLWIAPKLYEQVLRKTGEYE